MIKLRTTFKALYRRLRKAGKFASKRGKKVLKFGLRQLRIRPRIRLSFGVIVALSISFVLSVYAVSYLRPKEAEIKINGQPILASSREEEPQVPNVEISQEITVRRSPFEFRKPVDSGYISQGFSTYHPANDIAAAFNSPIHPVGSGIVEFAGTLSDGRGNVVIVTHGDGLKSLYAHMSKIEVGVGNMVNASTEIGTVGLTGHTTGPHVHLEITDGDKFINPSSILPE